MFNCANHFVTSFNLLCNMFMKIEIFMKIEMQFINCKINKFLTWSDKCIIATGDYDYQVPKVAITNTKLYVPVVTLSAQDNKKLLQQLKTGFKRTVNWDKYQSEPTIHTQNQYLNHLIDPSFYGVNRLWKWCKFTSDIFFRL